MNLKKFFGGLVLSAFLLANNSCISYLVYQGTKNKSNSPQTKVLSAQDQVINFIDKNRYFAYGENSALDSYALYGAFEKGKDGKSGVLRIDYDFGGPVVKFSRDISFAIPEIRAYFKSNRKPEQSVNIKGKTITKSEMRFYPEGPAYAVEIDNNSNQICEKKYWDLDGNGYLETVEKDLNEDGAGKSS